MPEPQHISLDATSPAAAPHPGAALPASASDAPLPLRDLAAALPELWSPRVVARVNDHLLKVVRVAGEFPWHAHGTQDELFLVLEGTLLIGRAPADGGPLTLRAGESFTVPRGIRHNTSTPAGTEALIALVEPADTLHTGAEVTPLTRSLAEQLR